MFRTTKATLTVNKKSTYDTIEFFHIIEDQDQLEFSTYMTLPHAGTAPGINAKRLLSKMGTLTLTKENEDTKTYNVKI